jgi:ectoine hydroxylase-related dioxygenase (phytanoyl-CoA dioxygenase family)
MDKKSVLNQDQLAFFGENGFLIVRKLYSKAETEQISDWSNELASAPDEAGYVWKYFETESTAASETSAMPDSVGSSSRILCRIENFVPFHQGFRELITGNRMQKAVSEILGEPAVLFKDKINFKLAGGDGFKEHQDVQAGWNEYADLHITAMVAIDETNEQNGSLEVIGGLHDKGVLGEMWAPLTHEDTEQRPYVAVHCEPGDTVFFNSFAPHRSAPNYTDQSRRVLYITYNGASAGDCRERYYAEKHKNYPPDIERDPDRDYNFKV